MARGVQLGPLRNLIDALWNIKISNYPLRIRHRLWIVSPFSTVGHGLLYFLWINHSFPNFEKAIFCKSHEVTVKGLQTPQKKFLEKISTFPVASTSQSLDIKEGAADAQVVL